jgi:heme-degrading monooxygenase HmoA
VRLSRSGVVICSKPLATLRSNQLPTLVPQSSTMEKLVYKRFLLVRDDFYQDPQAVAAAAKAARYFEPEGVTGFRSTEVYHPPGIKQKLERILGIKITRWDTDPKQENGVFYQGFSQGHRKEVPGVHSDWPYNDITILVYLTQQLPFDCGTSLWMHKATGLTGPPTPQDARRLKMKHAALVELFEQDSQKRAKWMEIDRVGHRFNRMVAYPSGALHSATRHYGSNNRNGRLYQTFRVGVDWDSFRITQAPVV